MKPIIHEEGITYAYISHKNLYLLAVSRTNVNAVSTLYFLHRMVDVFKFYFEVRRLHKRDSCECVMKGRVAAAHLRRTRRAALSRPAPLAGAGRGVAA